MLKSSVTTSTRLLWTHFYRPQTRFGNIFAPVCHSVHRFTGGGGVPGQVHPRTRYTPPGPGTHNHTPRDQVHTPRTREIRATSRQYASYWNAFLLCIKLHVVSGTQCKLNWSWSWSWSWSWFRSHISSVWISHNGLFRLSLNGTGKEWVTVYYAEPSHCNLCGTGTCTYTLALYQSRSQSRSRSHISSVWISHKAYYIYHTGHTERKQK